MQFFQLFPMAFSETYLYDLPFLDKELSRLLLFLLWNIDREMVSLELGSLSYQDDL